MDSEPSFVRGVLGLRGFSEGSDPSDPLGIPQFNSISLNLFEGYGGLSGPRGQGVLRGPRGQNPAPHTVRGVCEVKGSEGLEGSMRCKRLEGSEGYQMSEGLRGWCE